MSRVLTKFQTDDPILNRIQDHLIDILNPALRSVRNPIVTDWEAFVPLLNNNTNVSSNLGLWRRVGDSVEVMGAVTWNGNGAGSTWTSRLPEPLAMSRSLSLQTFPMSVAPLGVSRFYRTNSFAGSVRRNTDTTIAADYAGTGAFISGNALSGDELLYRYTVPIAGWTVTTGD